MKTTTETDSAIVAEWQTFLKMFKDIDCKSKDAKQQYEELKKLILHSTLLTTRQVELLTYRCNNAEEYWKRVNREVVGVGKPEKK